MQLPKLKMPSKAKHKMKNGFTNWGSFWAEYHRNKTEWLAKLAAGPVVKLKKGATIPVYEPHRGHFPGRKF